MERFLKKYLSDADLDTIANTIAEVEKNTSGQIRICIRQRRHWRERKLSLHDLTVNEFHRMGMQLTKHRTGVLILLLISERKFHIVADRGIHEKVKDGTWEQIAGTIAKHFAAGNFCAGICNGIQEAGEVLAAHFPNDGGAQELPSTVEVA